MTDITPSHELHFEFTGTPEEKACYDAGYDAGANGATEENSHFQWFTSAQKTAYWQKGYDDARNKSKP